MYKNWNHVYTILKLIGNDELKKLDHDFNLWFTIGRHPAITANIILSEPDWPISYGYLSSKPDLDLNYVMAKPGKPWNYKTIIAGHPGVTWGVVKQFNCEWSAKYDILLNPAITWAQAKLMDIPDKEKVRFIRNRNMTWYLYYTELKLYKMYFNYDNNKYELLRLPTTDFAKLMFELNSFYYHVFNYMRTYHERFKVDIYDKYWTAEIKTKYKYEDILADQTTCIKYLSDLINVVYADPVWEINAINFTGATKFDGMSMVGVYNLMVRVTSYASKNPNITYPRIKAILYKFRICGLLRNKHLTVFDKLDILRQYPYEQYQGSNYYYVIKDIYYTAELRDQYPELELINKQLCWQYKPNIGYRDVLQAVDKCNPMLTWKQIWPRIDKLQLKQIALNKFQRDSRYKYHLAWKYYNLWRNNVARRRCRVVYDCCLHELQMRWRDAGQVM